MAINLAVKYAKQIAEKYTHESFVAGNTSNQYDWSGVKTVNILTPVTVALGTYDRTASANRFGTPGEMQDTRQELSLAQDKSFAIAVDKGNDMDQNGIKAGARMLNLEIKEQVVPTIDKYALGKFDALAGTRKSITSDPSKSDIVGHIFDAVSALDNALVPFEGRILYIGATYYNALRQSTEFLAADSLVVKNMTKGFMGYIADCAVVKVPDAYLGNAYFIITHKDAVIVPQKIKTARIQNDAPGIDGVLLEGRYYFDAFVIGAKAAGVYSAAKSSSIIAAPVLTNTSNVITIGSVSGVTFKYTVDGTDPRYSATAATYASGVTLTSGQTFTACGTKSGVTSALATESYA